MDTGAGAAKIKYKIIPKGQNEEDISWTTEGRSTVKPDLTDGEYKIKAITIDKAGRESDIAERDVKKDSIAPTGVSITVKNFDSGHIKVIVAGEDSLSGLHNYIFQYRVADGSNSIYQIADTITTNNSPYTYTYSGLKRETKYDIKVIAKDKAGNETRADTSAQTNNNAAPEILDIWVDSKDTDRITIGAKAKDEDGDNLTYFLYVGTTEDNLKQVDISAGITADISQTTGTTVKNLGLTQYTTYYYRIDVTDQKTTTEGEINYVRTYCPSTAKSCNGKHACTNCNGGITIAYGQFPSYVNAERAEYGIKWNTNLFWHPVKGTNMNAGGTGSPFCYDYGTKFDGEIWNYNSTGVCGGLFAGKHWNRVWKCHDCQHTGSVVGCEHGFNASHTYCEHDGVIYCGKHD